MVKKFVVRLGFVVVCMHGGVLGAVFHGKVVADEVLVVQKFSDLPVEVQVPVARFLVGGKIVEIEEAKAHKVVEVKISYLRENRLHELVWDATNQKMLGGTESEVIQEVLGGIPQKALEAVENAKGHNQVKRIKIKHADADDHEYVHVHFVDGSGMKTDVKLEMDGSLQKQVW